jgi:hypothetical protein
MPRVECSGDSWARPEHRRQGFSVHQAPVRVGIIRTCGESALFTPHESNRWLYIGSSILWRATAARLYLRSTLLDLTIFRFSYHYHSLQGVPACLCKLHVVEILASSKVNINPRGLLDGSALMNRAGLAGH